MRLLKVNEELSRFIFKPPWVGSEAASLSATHVLYVGRTAEKDFVPHVCFRNSGLLWNLSLHFLPAESRSTLHQFCIMVLSWRKCSQLWYESAANQRTIVEIECSATVGWKWGYQPFSCPCSQNVTHCREEICSTCLFKTYIPAVPFWNSKHLLPTRSRFLRATVRSTSSALLLHHAANHAHPFVAAEEKKQSQSHAEKQRVWSRSCGLQDLLRTIQWLCPRFGLQGIDCALSCDMWLLQTNEPLSRLSL